jgi:hypothetical protein
MSVIVNAENDPVEDEPRLAGIARELIDYCTLNWLQTPRHLAEKRGPISNVLPGVSEKGI